jgi:hypothetical protein
MGTTTLNRGRTGLAAVGIAMALANMSPPPALADHKMFLPVGTIIPVKLDRSLSSKTSQPGDKVVAILKEGRDDGGLPPGTRIEGVVREALPSGDGKPGVLDIDFRRIVIPGNESRAIDGSLYSLNGKDVKRRDGRLVATADKSKDRLKWVGIGAGAGVVIGALTKGNALFNAVLGAGAGYLYNELSNKKPGDVNLKEGTEFGVRLDKAISFNVDDRNYDRFKGQLDDRYQDDRSNRDSRDRDRRNDDRYYRKGDSDNDRDRLDHGYSEGTRRDSGDIGVMVDDREVRFGSAKPFVRNDVVFVPLEPVSKMVDAKYQYNTDERTIRARDGKVRMTVGSRVAFVNGERRVLRAPSEMRDGVVYVPMQFVGWLTNGSTSWDKDSRTVIVTTDRDR